MAKKGVECTCIPTFDGHQRTLPCSPHTNTGIGSTSRPWEGLWLTNRERTHQNSTTCHHHSTHPRRLSYVRSENSASTKSTQTHQRAAVKPASSPFFPSKSYKGPTLYPTSTTHLCWSDILRAIPLNPQQSNLPAAPRPIV